MSAHPVLWSSPQPLWGRFGGVGGAAFRADDQARPALLRFASDEFMQQILAMLEADPRRIGEIIARPETWRNPSGDTPDLAEPVRKPRLARVLARLRTGAAPSTALTTTAMQESTKVNGVDRTLPLKLYHPAHQRHYLVAANLVCGIPGFPDRAVATGGREQIGFVLRRLMPESSSTGAPIHEYAFVKDGRGPHWERVQRNTAAPDPYAQAVNGEEMLPLFPLNFRDDVDHPRRLLAGTIPVGRREEYMSSPSYEAPLAPGDSPTIPAGTDPTTAARTKKSARKEQFKLDVSEPWKATIRAMYKAAERIAGGTPEPPSGSPLTPLDMRRASLRQVNEGSQHQSWLLLLDFADFLANHVPTVWQAVTGTAASPTLPDTGKQNLFNWINSTGSATPGSPSEWQLAGASFATSLRDAFKKINALGVRDKLEGANTTFVTTKVGTNPWPNFFYLFAGVRETSSGTFAAAGVQGSLASTSTPAIDNDDVEPLPQSTAAEADAAKVDKLVQLVIAAVDADATTPAPPIPFAVQLRDAMASDFKRGGDTSWFIIRCAYVRCDCGPLQPVVFSVPSQKFQLASFFDFDAPARPIRIALPIDTTVSGFRKHQKNTAFVLSDALCGQVNRLKGLGFVDLVLSVLPWPFHKDLDIGSEGLGPCGSAPATFGMICSLSIPIITICALILLFMIMLVLDLIFHWVPWFIICFPLPGFKAKKAT